MLETLENSFTGEYLEEIDKNTKMIPLIFDLVYKNIFLRYHDYYKRMYYNKNVEMKEDELWLAAFMTDNFISLNEILKNLLGDNLREKLIKDMVKMSMDDVILDEYERHTLDLTAEIDSKRIEREEALQEGMSIVREEGIILTIKSMIENKLDYETISKVTGKTIEEIKEIENSMEVE